MTCAQETENRDNSELTLICIPASLWEAPKELIKTSLQFLCPKAGQQDLQGSEYTKVFSGLTP